MYRQGPTHRQPHARRAVTRRFVNDCLLNWESRFPAETVDEGIAVTQAIWRDMLSFDGYLEHTLIHDLDQPGHLFICQPLGEPRGR